MNEGVFEYRDRPKTTTYEVGRLSSRTCAGCGHDLDAYSATVKGTKPEPGDISVCAYCYKIQKFSEDLELFDLSEQDIEHMKESGIWDGLQESIAEAKAKRNGTSPR